MSVWLVCRCVEIVSRPTPPNIFKISSHLNPFFKKFQIKSSASISGFFSQFFLTTFHTGYLPFFLQATPRKKRG